MLTDQQWSTISKYFPERRRTRGRPWVSNRAAVEGILWVARNGARWRDLPATFPSASTCWRRLRQWEEEGLWLQAWQQLLRTLDRRSLLDWNEAFLDATFIVAKKGALEWAKPCAARVQSAWWWSMARAFLWEFNSRAPSPRSTSLPRARSRK